MTRKRRNGHARRRSFSEGDVRTRTKRAKKQQNEGPSSNSGASADTVAHFQALQRSSHSALLADVFEWLGDAVIGELVGRCLLSQFHSSPLSARVFRNLRLSVVANRNLAKVYEAMGYAAVRRRSLTDDGTQAGWKATNMKQRADVVEAVVGELVLKLHQQPSDPEGYRRHLDAVLAGMLHAHFADRTRAAEEKGEAVLSAKGPLTVAFNPFACLPEEQLDETTGELLVTDGVFEDEAKEEERSCADLVDAYTGAVKAGRDGSRHHYFPPVKPDDVSKTVSETSTVKLAMTQLDEGHALRTSGEIFEVFKIYGMAVLSERMSLSLALPHMSIQQAKSSELVTPARLTRQRQLVLSVANLAACAVALEIAERCVREEEREESEEEAAARSRLEAHGLANTLRAFVGFHSAVATTSTAVNRRSNELVSDVCAALYESAYVNQSEFRATALYSAKIPEREPLVAMMRSVGEARLFMNSKTCDDLHARGERPMSDAALERERRLKSTFLLRQCDSNKLEDLFETLHREQEAQRRQSQASSTTQPQRKRTKKKRPVERLAVNAGCVTQTLERFVHRRFLFCLEEIVILFAQRKTEACRSQIALFEPELEPCADQPHLRKWEVTTSTLTLAMRDSFFRMLLHDICQFHAIVSSSRNTRDGTRITQLRLPLDAWASAAPRA